MHYAKSRPDSYFISKALNLRTLNWFILKQINNKVVRENEKKAVRRF